MHQFLHKYISLFGEKIKACKIICVHLKWKFWRWRLFLLEEKPIKAIARVEEINRKKMYRKKRYGTSKYDFWNDPNVSDIHKQEHARALKEDEADSFNRKIALARDEADSFKRSDN